MNLGEKKFFNSKWKRYHIFCTNIDVTETNIDYLAELYKKKIFTETLKVISW